MVRNHLGLVGTAGRALWRMVIPGRVWQLVNGFKYLQELPCPGNGKAAEPEQSDPLQLLQLRRR